jgi:hypothetical protein
MPVVHVRALPPGRPVAAGLVEVARAVAAAVPCDLGSVWCTFQELAAQAVGDRVPAAGEGVGQIAYVDVWQRDRPADPGAAAGALEAACRATAAWLGLPVEDVWGALHPVEPGRVFAGGGLVG